MPLGLVRKWTLVAILAAAIGMIACKDDDDNPMNTPDSGGGTPGGGDSGTTGGGGDSGTTGGGGDSGTTGGGDAGLDAGPATVMCGTKTCSSFTFALNGMVLAPGCVTDFADAAQCGISTSLLGGADAGLPPFLEKDPANVPSVPCADFIDDKEPPPTGDAGSTQGNSRINVIRAMMPFDYPGCCTAAGFCSANVSMGKLLGTVDSNAGYGCMNPAIFLASLPGAFADAGSRFIPCDPVSGALKPPSDGGAGDGGAGDGGAGDAGAGDGGASDASEDGGNS